MRQFLRQLFCILLLSAMITNSPAKAEETVKFHKDIAALLELFGFDVSRYDDGSDDTKISKLLKKARLALLSAKAEEYGLYEKQFFEGYFDLVDGHLLWKKDPVQACTYYHTASQKLGIGGLLASKERIWKSRAADRFPVFISGYSLLNRELHLRMLRSQCQAQPQISDKKYVGYYRSRESDGYSAKIVRLDANGTYETCLISIGLLLYSKGRWHNAANWVLTYPTEAISTADDANHVLGAAAFLADDGKLLEDGRANIAFLRIKPDQDEDILSVCREYFNDPGAASSEE